MKRQMYSLIVLGVVLMMAEGTFAVSLNGRTHENTEGTIASLAPAAISAPVVAGRRSSPFAGRYCLETFGPFDISKSGRIRGSGQQRFGGGSIRWSIAGTITDEGNIKVTFTYASRQYGGWSELVSSATGWGTLDEDSNIDGWLTSEDGESHPFEWVRC